MAPLCDRATPYPGRIGQLAIGCVVLVRSAGLRKRKLAKPQGRHERPPCLVQRTPSFFCRLDDDVVYWNSSFLSG